MNYSMPFSSTQTVTLVKRVVQAWNVPAVVIEEELKRQNVRRLPLPSRACTDCIDCLTSSLQRSTSRSA